MTNIVQVKAVFATNFSKTTFDSSMSSSDAYIFFSCKNARLLKKKIMGCGYLFWLIRQR
jgi:hypothetical protein